MKLSSRMVFILYQLSKRPSFVYNGYDAYPNQPMKLVLHRVSQMLRIRHTSFFFFRSTQASSAEPMLNHEIVCFYLTPSPYFVLLQTPVRHMTKGTLPLSAKRSFSKCRGNKEPSVEQTGRDFYCLDDHSGYISDGPCQKYSLSKKSSSTNLDRTKSSSMKGIKNLFGRIIRTNSGNIQEDDENLFHRGGCRGTMTSEKSLK